VTCVTRMVPVKREPPSAIAGPLNCITICQSFADLSRASVFSATRGHTVMFWLRRVHQSLSYKLGFAHARRRKPCKCPWWADRIVYGQAYIDG